MVEGRIVIIPFLHGKLDSDGTVVEPDIEAILEKWLERHPEFRGRQFHFIRGSMTIMMMPTTSTRTHSETKSHIAKTRTTIVRTISEVMV